MHIAVARRILADFSITQIEVIENTAVYFLASDGRVWYSVLEDEDEKSQKAPSFPTPFMDLPRIKKIFNNNYPPAIFLLDDNNEVWVCAERKWINWLNADEKRINWLGLGGSLTKPVKNGLKNIKEISTHGHFIFLLNIEGYVFISRITNGISISKDIKLIENIVHMTDGSWGLFFIDRQGEVCKAEVNDLNYGIIKMEGPSHIISITKGDKQHHFLDQDGKVWKHNSHGNELIKLDSLPPIKQIITNDCPSNAVQFVTYFIDHKDNVWVYGNSDNGLLGLGEKNKVTEPTQLESLPTIKQILTKSNETFLLDTNKKVWFLGIAKVNQSKKICSKPTLLETLPLINNMGMGYYAPNFIDEEGSIWVQYCTGTIECYSLGKAKAIKLIKTLGKQGDLFIDDENTLQIKIDSKKSGIKTPFNFSDQYIKKAIESCHLTFNELIVLASSRNRKDYVFQHALITVLSDQNKATQFYYITACFFLKLEHSINSDIMLKLAALLFNPGLGHSKQQHTTILTQENKKRYAVAEAFINLYMYFNNKSNNYIHHIEEKNFILMLIKLAQNEISNINELKSFIINTNQSFAMWSSDFFKSLIISQYSSLRNQLLISINEDAGLFQYFKILTYGFKELFSENFKKNIEMESYIVDNMSEELEKYNQITYKFI